MFRYSLQTLTTYQSHTFRTRTSERVKNKDEAVEFINQRGFAFFWPIKDVLLPNLWTAVAGDRLVPDNHDDPGHITWDWKDSLLDKRCWYYARLLRRRNTIVSLDTAPFFYALSQNFGDWEEDYLYLYEQGLMTLEAKLLYEALLKNGPLDTIALRKAAHLASPGSEARFNRALDDLQIDLKILPVGIADAGSWHYAFIYDIVPRYYPDLPVKAHEITERVARRRLAELYWRSLGAATFAQARKCLGWGEEDLARIVDDLEKDGILRNRVEIDGLSGEWIALRELG